MSNRILVIHDKKSPNTVLCKLIEYVTNSNNAIDFSLSTLVEAPNLSNRDFSLILFVIPILGDNDLLPKYQLALVNFLKYFKPIGFKMLVLLQGDRHLSDDSVNIKSPIAVKLSNTFRLFSAFRLESTKLDFDTSKVLAEVIQQELSETDIVPAIYLDYISDILEKRPKWESTDKKLDFFERTTGYSLLTDLNSNKLIEIGNLIRKSEPNILNISHANMNYTALKALGSLPSVIRAQLSSNRLKLEYATSIFPNCEDLNLAANMLDTIQINESMSRIQTLMLHKNTIKKIIFNSSKISKIKRLSLYRNELSFFEWPAENTELEYLNLGANPINMLPESLSQAKQLRFLGVARSRISALPEWIFTLPKLEELDISYIEDRLPKHQLEKLRSNGVLLINRPN